MSDMGVQAQQSQRPVQQQQEAAHSQQVGDKLASEQARASQQRPMEGAQLEAAASVQQRAGEKFQQFSSQATAHAEPAMPSGARSVEKAAEPKATPEQQFNQAADKLAANSPTAKAQLDKFRAEGGRFEDGGAAGYFKDGSPPTIGIPTKTPLGTQTSERDRMQTIAHELGHHNFARTQPNQDAPPTNGHGGHSDATIEARRENAYVQRNAERHLGNEAHATEFNARVRDEMRRKTGVDIGVAGVRPGEPVPSKQQLIDHYGKLTPSTSPNENYRSYYNRPYREHYQQHFAPGRPGNLM